MNKIITITMNCHRENLLLCSPRFLALPLSLDWNVQMSKEEIKINYKLKLFTVCVTPIIIPSFFRLLPFRAATASKPNIECKYSIHIWSTSFFFLSPMDLPKISLHIPFEKKKKWIKKRHKHKNIESNWNPLSYCWNTFSFYFSAFCTIHACMEIRSWLVLCYYLLCKIWNISKRVLTNVSLSVSVCLHRPVLLHCCCSSKKFYWLNQSEPLKTTFHKIFYHTPPIT